MSRPIVTVTAERGTGWWVLEAPEAGAVSQCKRLTQAADEMREAIAYQLGLEPDGFDIDVQVILPQSYQDELEAADEQSEMARRATSAAAEHRRAAAQVLSDEGLSVRDIGEVMGVSHQRAAQLLEHSSGSKNTGGGVYVGNAGSSGELVRARDRGGRLVTRGSTGAGSRKVSARQSGL